MKSQLSSFELRHLLQEFQFLIGAKIEKIFQQPKPRDEFLIVLHVPSVGKQYLYVSLPDVLCLSSFKPVFPEVPPHFAASLRRKISNARIQSITQKDFERIVIIELSTKNGTSFLILELFSPGNIILINEENVVLSVLHPKKWQDRAILPAKPFEFPPSQKNPLLLSLDDFSKIIKSTDKESLVKALAIELSLGGEYSEELLFRLSIDKNLSPNSLPESDIEKLFFGLKDLFNQETSAFKSSSAIYPIKLQSKSDIIPVDSFNDAIQERILSSLKAQEESSFTKQATKSQSKFEKIIQAQKAQLESLEKSADLNQAKGELIYSHYSSLKTLLDKVDSLRSEGKSWAEIKQVLSVVSQIKKIDESKGVIELDLEVVQ